MGPILSITFGLSTLNWEIVKRGMRNEFIGVLITLVVGMFIGLCGYPVYGAGLRSDEMMGRGKRKKIYAQITLQIYVCIYVCIFLCMYGICICIQRVTFSLV